AHVYQVSPVMTLVEKHTTKYLASLFNLPSSSSGGISQPGGSASNATAMVIARNTLHPSTKEHGNGALKLRIFTSAHGHYSVEKAANQYGFGTASVICVPVDSRGCMKATDLARLIAASQQRGETPFFVNATAGTTVYGSFDPFAELAALCKTHNLWLHIDASWGGPVIFSPKLAASRLRGAHLAHSITINPHKMLGVPLTCSFLLGADMACFHTALTLPAPYLFHNNDGHPSHAQTVHIDNVYDLADLTPQCGRRADSLKMFLALQYYGADHFGQHIEAAYQSAHYLVELLGQSQNFVLVSPRPLPCLQVCFYYARGGALADDADTNSKVTADMAARLVTRGFMIDYAPGDKGYFFRVVVNGGTRRGTVEGLVKALEETADHLGF
ncbi:Glutamate decarboxylase 2, partial [Pleosporales sp. CAS-2024a]